MCKLAVYQGQLHLGDLWEVTECKLGVPHVRRHSAQDEVLLG